MLEFIWPAIYVAAFYLFLNLKIAFEKLKLSLFMVYKASMLSYYAEGFKICIPSTMKTSTVQRHLDSFFFFTALLRYISHTMKSTHSRCTVRWFLV